MSRPLAAVAAAVAAILAAGAAYRVCTAPSRSDRAAARDGEGAADWLAAHESFRRDMAARPVQPDVLLVGDSFVAGWGPAGNRAWREHAARWSVASAGAPGDRARNVLWRLDDGACEGLRPRVVVLHVGANDVFDVPRTGPDAVADGIAACARRIRDLLPAARLVVVAVIPGFGPDSAFRRDARAANARLAALELGADPMVRVLDLWDEFVAPDGSLRAERFLPDQLHLSQGAGYDAYARRLAELLDADLSAAPGAPR